MPWQSTALAGVADGAICHSMMCEVVDLNTSVVVTARAHMLARASVNVSVYLHALALTFIPASVFVHIVSVLPSCVSVSELMTETPQPSLAWAEAPGRPAERRDIV